MSLEPPTSNASVDHATQSADQQQGWHIFKSPLSKNGTERIGSENSPSLQSASSSSKKLNDITWSMIDKTKYFPLTIVNMFAVRSFLYPLTLVRTRLQVQSSGALYSGTLNALTTITRYEGFGALYKGFWLNSFQVVPHVIYITSFEVKKN